MAQGDPGELTYLEPTTTPTSTQDPSTPRLRHTDAIDTGRTDADGQPILRQTVAIPTSAVNAITASAFNLQSGAYSATSSLPNDYLLNKIEFVFTTTVSRRITITRSDGSVLFSETNTALNLELEEIDEAIKGGENFTIAITQTTAACAVTLRAVVVTSSATIPSGGTIAASQSGAWTVAATQSGNWAAELADLNGNLVSKNAGHVGSFSISTPASSATPFVAGLNAYGTLRVSDEPHAVFRDLFDTAGLDYVGNWNATPAGGIAASVSAGAMTLPTGTTGSAWSQLSSQVKFCPPIPGFIQPSFNIQLESGTPVTQGSRFWGLASTPATPTVSAPLTDAIGWLLDVDGKLYAVVYAAGTALVKIDVSASQKTDGVPHRYLLQARTDQVHWYIDSLDPGNRVAFASQTVSTPIVSPNVQTLSVMLQQVNGSTQTNAMTFKTLGAIVADTANNASQQSDANYPGVKESLLPMPAAGVPGGNYGGAGLTHDPAVYLASARAGHVLFGATTGFVSGVSTAPWMLFENPAGSGIVCFVWRLTLGAAANIQLSRYRNPTISTRGTAVTEVNAGGGTNRSAGKLYGAGQVTVSANGTLGKGEFLAQNTTLFIDEKLTMQVQPGQAVMWLINTSTTMVGEVVWAEMPAF